MFTSYSTSYIFFNLVTKSKFTSHLYMQSKTSNTLYLDNVHANARYINIKMYTHKTAS